MKKYVMAIFAIAASFAGANLQADVCCSENDYCSENFYLGGFGGVNFLDNIHVKEDRENDIKEFHVKFKPGFVGGVAMGYKFQDYLRLEAELSFRRNPIKDAPSRSKVTTETYAVLGNLYFDVDTGSCYGLYFGGGLGWARNRAQVHADRSLSISAEGSSLAFQGIAGISYRICYRTDLGFEYRYFGSKSEIRDQTIGVSLKHYF